MSRGGAAWRQAASLTNRPLKPEVVTSSRQVLREILAQHDGDAVIEDQLRRMKTNESSSLKHSR
jgi:hypothetical protein